MQHKTTLFTCKSNDYIFIKEQLDTQTGNYIDENVGRCNRENKCGYHFTPKAFFSISWRLPTGKTDRKKQKQETAAKIQVIEESVFNQSVQNYQYSNLYLILIHKFNREMVDGVFQRYRVGFSRQWNNSTLFWYLDSKGRIRDGKIMLYNLKTGTRVKKPVACITWVHCCLKLENFQSFNGLYGEHLLIDKEKPVALVESEKTALIASICIPEYLWLATGGLSNLTSQRRDALKDRTVILFLDINGYELWRKKAFELSDTIRVSVSDYLEKVATASDRKEELDLGDYLLENNSNY